jgi:protein translocase SecG subunit
MKTTLLIIQIIVAILIIILIVLQPEGKGFNMSFTSGGENYHTKRGAEKVMSYLTIGLVVLFLILSILNLSF